MLWFIQVTVLAGYRRPVVIVDDRLTFSDHIMSVVHISNVILTWYVNAFFSRDCDLSVKAYTTYVRPWLEYCTVVWSPYHTGLVNRIESVQLKVFHICIIQIDCVHWNFNHLKLAVFNLIWFFCYKIVHGLLNVRFDDFSAWRTPLLVAIITNWRSITLPLMHANFIFQIV